MKRVLRDLLLGLSYCLLPRAAARTARQLLWELWLWLRWLPKRLWRLATLWERCANCGRLIHRDYTLGSAVSVRTVNGELVRWEECEVCNEQRKQVRTAA
jgi:hypothetical protein